MNHTAYFSTTRESHNRFPGSAKSAIEKAAEGGKIVKVESVTGNGITDYEAVIAKGDTNSEIKVTAEGAIIE
jgi:hypothetical protein